MNLQDNFTNYLVADHKTKALQVNLTTAINMQCLKLFL